MSEAGLDLRPARPEDLPAVGDLLVAAGLPSDDVTLVEQDFFLAFDRGILVGCVGLERRGTVALLRSLAVAATHRGHGRGDALHHAALAFALQQGVTRVYLFTQTAEAYFLARGFQREARAALPPAIAATSQAQGGCCSSAACLSRSLG